MIVLSTAAVLTAEERALVAELQATELARYARQLSGAEPTPLDKYRESAEHALRHVGVETGIMFSISSFASVGTRASEVARTGVCFRSSSDEDIEAARAEVEQKRKERRRVIVPSEHRLVVEPEETVRKDFDAAVDAVIARRNNPTPPCVSAQSILKDRRMLPLLSTPTTVVYGPNGEEVRGPNQFFSYIKHWSIDVDKGSYKEVTAGLLLPASLICAPAVLHAMRHVSMGCSTPPVYASTPRRGPNVFESLLEAGYGEYPIQKPAHGALRQAEGPAAAGEVCEPGQPEASGQGRGAAARVGQGTVPASISGVPGPGKRRIVWQDY
jgi:hypothetical protein